MSFYSPNLPRSAGLQPGTPHCTPPCELRLPDCVELRAIVIRVIDLLERFVPDRAEVTGGKAPLELPGF